MDVREEILRIAFREWLSQSGVLSIDTEMKLNELGYSPEIVLAHFGDGETPSIIIKKEED